MHPVLRSVIAVVAGAVVSAVVISLVEMVSSKMYPLPEGMDPNDLEALKKHVATLPAGAFLMVLTAWFLGTLTGGVVACLIARRRSMVHACVIAVIFLAAAVFMMLVLPHPAWFWAPGVLVFPTAAWLAASLVPTPQLAPSGRSGAAPAR